MIELILIPVYFFSGVIFHFIYKWSRKSHVAVVFGAVNESLWEHMKIAFWPMFLGFLLQYIWYGYTYNNFITAKALSLILVTITIPFFVKLYTYFTRKNIFPVDLFLFLLCIAIAQAAAFVVLQLYDVPAIVNAIALVCLFILVMIYSVWTTLPPRADIFRDPISGVYGEKPHKHKS
jgi:hypothetical protein